MDKRYGNGWELKTFISKANQKCRDTKPGSTSAEV